jgi:hypothetical protein
MFRPWVKWLVNHNLKAVLYLIWLLVLPFFLLAYLENAAEDAMHELKDIRKLEKE